MTRAFAAAAADLLLNHGPLSKVELHELALTQGLTKAKNPSSLSLAGERFVVRPDGRYDTAARLLLGQVFTTRACPGSDDVLWTYRDLDPLAALESRPLQGGGALSRGQGDVESWVGPAGWAPGRGPGEPAGLLALRWSGRELETSLVTDVPGGDSDIVRDVREVLARHARSEHRYGWSSVPRTSLTGTVLSALMERPSLFASPLPPLRELLPLPEDLRPSDSVYEHDRERSAIIVEVPLPLRVHDELTRRADLIGELFPDYLTLLLGAAADRVQLPPPRYERYEPYGGSYRSGGGDVIQLDGWGR